MKKKIEKPWPKFIGVKEVKNVIETRQKNSFYNNQLILFSVEWFIDFYFEFSMRHSAKISKHSCHRDSKIKSVLFLIRDVFLNSKKISSYA